MIGSFIRSFIKYFKTPCARCEASCQGYSNMFCILPKLLCTRGFINSSCFIQRRGRCEQGHGAVGKQWEIQVCPVGGWGWQLVEGDSIKEIEWDSLYSFTLDETILKIFFSVYQYLGLLKYLNKSRMTILLWG